MQKETVVAEKIVKVHLKVCHAEITRAVQCASSYYRIHLEELKVGKMRIA